MKRRTLAFLLQVPVFIILAVLFFGFIYVVFNVPGITFAHGLPVWLSIIAFFWGRAIEKYEMRHYY